MSKNKVTFENLMEGIGPEYILLNKYDEVYRTWTTSETFPELIETLLAQVPEKNRIKIANEILEKSKQK